MDDHNIAPRVGDEGQWTSPVLNVGGFLLSFDNTRVRMFGTGYEQFNHIEYTNEDGVQGIRVPQDIIQSLLDNEYPASYDYFPDLTTFEWFVKRLLDDTIEVDQIGLPASFDDLM